MVLELLSAKSALFTPNHMVIRHIVYDVAKDRNASSAKGRVLLASKGTPFQSTLAKTKARWSLKLSNGNLLPRTDTCQGLLVPTRATKQPTYLNLLRS